MAAVYDPRPDIKGDHLLWDVLLRTAYRADKEEYQPRANLLHGLRCGGASLEVRANGTWKMDPGAALAYLEPWKQQHFRGQLQGNVAWYKDVFLRAAELYQQAEKRIRESRQGG